MNNIKSLPRLLVFATVAQTRSFTKAGETLGVSKSAVSQQISQLEKDMGIQLLNRNTRGMSLTAMGDKLLERCVLLQDQVAHIFSDIDAVKDNPKGRFAITYPHALESSVVLPAIEQLCLEYPGLEPDLKVDDKSFDLIDSNLDVAVHIGALPDSNYRALPLGLVTEIFCATPRYLNQTVIDQAQDMFGQYKWIATDWQSANTVVTKVANGNQENIKLRCFAKVNTLPTAIDMALRHLGLVLLPDIVANKRLKSGELVHVRPDINGPKWPVYMVHTYQNKKPIHITRFHQLLNRFFSNEQMVRS